MTYLNYALTLRIFEDYGLLFDTSIFLIYSYKKFKLIFLYLINKLNYYLIKLNIFFIFRKMNKNLNVNKFFNVNQLFFS